MKQNALISTATSDIATTFSFKSAELNKFSESIAKIAIDSVERNIELSRIFGRILATECYKEDGFSSVADYANKTFGIEKAQAYALARVGNRFFNSDSKIAERVVKELKGKTSNLAELVNMSDSDIESALDAKTITSESTQKDLRQVAASHKPESTKVITEKHCIVRFAVADMTELRVDTSEKQDVIVDNAVLAETFGFPVDYLKFSKIGDTTTTLYVEGREPKITKTGYEGTATSSDGRFFIRFVVKYTKTPKAKKPKTKKPALDPDEYAAFLAWKESQAK